MPGKNCLACFGTGSAAVAAAALALGYAWSEHSRVTTASTVHYPLLAALRELRVTAQSGEKEDLLRKLDQLSVCWSAYAFEKGQTPELFVSRIASGQGDVCGRNVDSTSGSPAGASGHK